jgi:hypothetical protein
MNDDISQLASPLSLPRWVLECVRRFAVDLEQWPDHPSAQYVRYGCIIWLEVGLKANGNHETSRQQHLIRLEYFAATLEAEAEKASENPDIVEKLGLKELLEKRFAYVALARELRAVAVDLQSEHDLDLQKIETDFRSAMFSFLDLPDPQKEVCA